MMGFEDFLFDAGRFRLDLSRRVHIMGIINLTPDSFSGDGLLSSKFMVHSSKNKIVDKAERIAEEMVRDGADIIDVGGESSRPGSTPVSEKEEMERVVPVIKRLSKRINRPISIDTYKSSVAKAALDAGACIVNDISGLRFDSRLSGLVKSYKAGLVIMHIKGRPRTMQKRPRYKSLIREIINYLRRSLEIALEAGIKKKRIVVDPGIGFGKTTLHNLQILKNLKKLSVLKRPILIGPSRKSFIGNILGVAVEERLFGTAASVALAVANGARIFRLHDVKEMAQVIRIAEAIVKSP